MTISGTDVVELLESMGFECPANLAASELAAAELWWQQATNSAPFLSASASWTFEPEDIMFDDGAGQWYIKTPNYFTAISAFTVSGQAMVDGTDYTLLPDNETQKTRIMFTGAPWATERAAIDLTVTEGWASEYPADAGLAIVKKAAAEVLATIDGEEVGAGGRLTQGPVTIQEGKESRAQRIVSGSMAVAARYRRF